MKGEPCTAPGGMSQGECHGTVARNPEEILSVSNGTKFSMQNRQQIAASQVTLGVAGLVGHQGGLCMLPECLILGSVTGKGSLWELPVLHSCLGSLSVVS